MKKLLVISLFLFSATTIRPWLWQVTIINKMPGLKYSVVDKFIYPGGVESVFSVYENITLNKLLLQAPDINPSPLGRKLEFWAQCGLGNGAVKFTNKVIMAKAEFITEEERNTAFILPMQPSGAVVLQFDKNAPCDRALTATLGTAVGQVIPTYRMRYGPYKFRRNIPPKPVATPVTKETAKPAEAA